jgi:hypothetical protein
MFTRFSLIIAIVLIGFFYGEGAIAAFVPEPTAPPVRTGSAGTR